MIILNVNGKTQQLDVGPDMPLLWAIRDAIGLTGTKYGCGIAQCGACTVHVDGNAVRSCSMPVSAAVGKKITTIEDVGATRTGKVVRRSWRSSTWCCVPESGQICLQPRCREKPEATAAIRPRHVGHVWQVRDVRAHRTSGCINARIVCFPQITC